jgi:hypothetical protein
MAHPFVPTLGKTLFDDDNDGGTDANTSECAATRWFEPRLRHELAMQALLWDVRTNDAGWIAQRHVDERAIVKMGVERYGLSPAQAMFCADELVHYQAPIERASVTHGCVPIPLLADGGAWQSDTAFDASLLARLNASFDVLEVAASQGLHRIVTHNNPAGGAPTQDLVFPARYGFRRPSPRMTRLFGGGYGSGSLCWAVERPGDCTEQEAAETFALLTESPSRAIECMGRCCPPSPTPAEEEEDQKRWEARQARHQAYLDKHATADNATTAFYTHYEFGEEDDAYSPWLSWKENHEAHAWMPCEVQMTDTGDRVRILSYVPGLHPERHSTVYTVLEEALAKFVPLWERVLAETVAPRAPRLVVPYHQKQIDDPEHNAMFAAKPESLTPATRALLRRLVRREKAEHLRRYHRNGVYTDPPLLPLLSAVAPTYDWRDTFGTLAHGHGSYDSCGFVDHLLGDAAAGGRKRIFVRETYATNYVLAIPDPTGTRVAQIENLQQAARDTLMTTEQVTRLAGRRLQVIVRMATSTGTDNGTWHIDGMPHEHIVASGAVTVALEEGDDPPPRIELRHTSNDNGFYVSSRDNGDAPMLWDTHPCDYGGRTRPIGHATTQVGRALAMANTWTHRVTGYRGRRRVLVFFLVDPWHRVTHSSGYVPPQDLEWARDYAIRTIEDVTRMPLDLVKLVWEQLAGGDDDSCDNHQVFGAWSNASATYHEAKMREARSYQVDSVKCHTIDAPDMSC